jgi:hypothetical protein
MSRLKVLFAQPRHAAGALVTLMLAAGAVVGSGADFTASAANPANTFATGTLTMDNSKASAAVLTASNLRPGGAASTGTVDIEDTGSLGATFTLSRGAISDSDTANPLSSKLNVVVTDCGVFAGSSAPACGDGDDTVKYSGSLAQMGDATHPIASLGAYASHEKHRYSFSVALDGTAGNAFQAATSSVQFDWSAA